MRFFLLRRGVIVRALTRQLIPGGMVPIPYKYIYKRLAPFVESRAMSGRIAFYQVRVVWGHGEEVFVG